jgi:YVTN family beta-propeller protein
MPQDTRLLPDGSRFITADMHANGVYVFDGAATKRIGFVKTGQGAHGIYFSRDGSRIYVSNRDEGSVSVLDAKTLKPVTKWVIPDGGSPDMGAVSADGGTLWLAGRYHGEVYAFDTGTGQLKARIPVGTGPHGLLVWPQPGQYSLGHTSNIR